MYTAITVINTAAGITATITQDNYKCVVHSQHSVIIMQAKLPQRRTREKKNPVRVLAIDQIWNRK